MNYCIQKKGIEMKDRLLQEQILDAWLKLSSVISNDRLVTGFSFNEALVLNLLYKQYVSEAEKVLTATDLCRQTNILKSQMNGILNSLEKKQMILRERSAQDRRQVGLKVNPEHVDEFIQCHERSLQLVDQLVERISEEEGRKAAVMINKLADTFARVLEKKDKELREADAAPKEEK